MITEITTYEAKLAHDHGFQYLRVVSLSSDEEAIQTIMACEHCPRSAIVALKKVKVKKVR